MLRILDWMATNITRHTLQIPPLISDKLIRTTSRKTIENSGPKLEMRSIQIAVFVLCFLATSISRGEDRHNIVFIMVDDLGWKDIACYGNRLVETPNIDRLAKNGIRFTDFYAAGTVCSATRCSVQSGQNQARIGITDFIPGHWRPYERVITPRPKSALPQEIVTVAESLKDVGYSTGYIGKWHLGNGPQFQPDK